MKPKTKLQVKVMSLSEGLSHLSKEQEKWAFKNCLVHIGYRTKTKIACLDCGNIWAGPQKVKSCICPGCGTKLKIEDSRKKNMDQGATVTLMSVVDGFQVNRFFEIKSYHSAGKSARQYIHEIVQQWYLPDGKLTVVSRSLNFSSFCWSSHLEVRANISNYWNPNKFNLWTDRIFPHSKFLPIYKRNGFTSKVYGVYLYAFLSKLLKDSKSETLLKAKQFSLLKESSGNKEHLVRRYWDSIKICLRNKYKVRDAGSYLDYLELLADAGKDLRSPKYVCPVNFSYEHNRLVAKRNRARIAAKRARNREEAERRKIHAEKEQIQYVSDKGDYFGLQFRDGDLVITILESVQEFIEEWEAHGHCLFTNRYYSRTHSLCFSARYKHKRVETIEVDLTNMKVVQSRGLDNKASIHHDQILELMNSSMPMISKRYAKGKMEAA